MPYYGYYGFGYDPLYLIIVLVTTVVGLMAQSYINSTYRRWSRVPSDLSLIHISAAVARWSRCTFHGRITRKQTKADRGTDMAQREIEIDEALAAVEDALDCLDAAARDLKSARSWGLLDMLGGGFWISAFKQGRMQAAQEPLNAAPRHLAPSYSPRNSEEGRT